MTAAAQPPSRLRELLCVWLSVPEPEPAAHLLESALGLRRRGQGEMSATPWEGSHSAGRRGWVLLGAPGFDRGLVCLTTGPVRQTSPGLTRGWDSVELVVRDVDAVAGRLRGQDGVVAVQPPFTADLSTLGGNMHRSAVWRMPWGTHLIVTAGLTRPVGRDFPTALGEVGPVFEVHLRTDRFDAARRLYVDVLGMRPFMVADFDDGPVHRAWGIQAGTPVRMELLKGDFAGTGEGAVELQGHRAEVLSPASPAGPPVGGTVMATYTTVHFDQTHRALAAGYQILAGPDEVTGGPFAGRRHVVVAGAEGERLQVIEKTQGGTA